MSISWSKTCNNVGADKRKNTNWDLLPPKPKKQATAFDVFAATDVRNGMENNYNFAHLQSDWNQLTNGRKRRYESIAEQNKKEILEWTEMKSNLKRPPGAFVLFMMDLWAEEKAKGKRFTLGQMSHKAKLAWSRAPLRKKNVYKTRAREILTKYNAFFDGFRSGKAVAVSSSRT